MKTLYQNLKAQLTRHQLFWGTLFFICIALLFSLWGTFVFMRAELTTIFQQIYEKKTWTEVETYHRSTGILWNEFFERRKHIVKRIAITPGLREALFREDFSLVTEMLDQQRLVNDQFDEYFVVDKEGIIRLMSSPEPDVKLLVGQSLAHRPYIQDTFAKKEAQVAHIPQTLSGRNKLFFTAPIILPDADIPYAIVGDITLEGIARRITLDSHFAHFESLLLNQEGEVLLKNGQNLPDHVNVKEKDRLVARVLSERRLIQDQEINYEGKRVFAQAQPLDSGAASFYLVTSYPVEEFEEEARYLRSEIGIIFSRLSFLGALFVLIFSLVLFGLISRHENIHRPR